MPEDLDKIVEAAFASVEPLDDRHRERLEKLRTMMLAGNRRMVATAEENEARNENIRAESGQNRELAIEIDRLTRERLGSMAGLFSEHAGLIDAIAAKS